MIRRICLYAGPGAGKSTAASFLFAQLKKQKVQIEQVNEYVKTWAHEGRSPTSFDQCYIFGKQLHAEDVLLKSGIPLIVTDSPLFLNITYARTLGPTCAYKPLSMLANEFEKVFPGLHIILRRDGIEYDEVGRFQKYDDALKLDQEIAKTVLEHTSNVMYCRSDDDNMLLNLVKESIKCQKTT